MKRLVRRVAEMPRKQSSELTGRILGLLQFFDDLPDQEEDRALILILFDARMRA
jgi:hypothetical protein